VVTGEEGSGAGAGARGAGIAGRSRRARGGDDGPKRAVLGLGSAEEDSGDRYTITPPLEGGSTRRGPDVDIARPRARVGACGKFESRLSELSTK